MYFYMSFEDYSPYESRPLGINIQDVIKLAREKECAISELTKQDLLNSGIILEHAIIINNFVSKVENQIKDNLCKVFGDSAQYQWREIGNEIVVPDASIMCNITDRNNVAFTGIPRFVMEVLSPSTEEEDRGKKMEIYRRVGVSEYWIVDWQIKKVEIYLFDGEADGTIKPYLYKTIEEQNKNELQIVMFPYLKLSFDELFYV